MPRCPKCGRKIKSLFRYQKTWERASFRVIQGETGVSVLLTWLDKDVDYDCPRCDQTLFHTEEDAVKFLSQEETA